MLKGSRPRNCKMTFIVGRGFTECQILKKWNRPYFMNWMEYFDKLLRKHWYWQDLAEEMANWYFLVGGGFCYEILHTHWYWQDVANEIVKWHLGFVEVLPRFKFWKSETGPISWTFWYILIKILHTNYYWYDLDRGIAKSSPRDCKMTFNIGRVCAELQILKKV